MIVESPDGAPQVHGELDRFFLLCVEESFPKIPRGLPRRIKSPGNEKGVAEEWAHAAFGEEKRAGRKEPRDQQAAGEGELAHRLAGAKCTAHGFPHPSNLHPFEKQSFPGFRRAMRNDAPDRGLFHLAPILHGFPAQPFPRNGVEREGLISCQRPPSQRPLAPWMKRSRIPRFPPSFVILSRIEHSRGERRAMGGIGRTQKKQWRFAERSGVERLRSNRERECEPRKEACVRLAGRVAPLGPILSGH